MPRIDTRSLAAEFVVIVIGVLVALGVDEWREGRKESAAERQYVERLITELESDSALMARTAALGERKAADLEETVAALGNPRQVREQPSLAFPNLGYTYARPELQTTTFDELSNTGGLSLIRDAEVRTLIGRHYHSVLHHYERLDDRRTPLAHTVAELFPGHAWGSGTGVEVTDAQMDSAFFASPNADARLDHLLGPEYLGLVNRELVYANSMDGISGTILLLTVNTLAALRDYAAELH